MGTVITDKDEVNNLAVISSLVGSNTYIAGKYDSLGKKLKDGKPVNQEDVETQKNLIERSASRFPGSSKISSKENKKVKKSKHTFPNKIEIVFNTNLGKIKTMAVDLLITDSALLLIYENESDVVYEPEAGTECILVTNRQEYNCYYPGLRYHRNNGEVYLAFVIKL